MKTIGKFEIVELLGRGAMGMVYKGWDPSLNRHVAVKVMTAHLDMDPELRARFMREAQAAGSLQHPNIITVFELGQSEGIAFIAMEYVPGRDVDDIIEAREPLRIVEKVDLIEQVCRGLAYAHDRQVVHRDIKPANIRVSESGQAKLMDFGVAHLVSSELTQTGSLLGTPFYMAPEVINGETVDARADIFSLGATFYELLAYSRPFQGENMQTLFSQILHKDPPPLQELGLDVPPLLQNVLDRCLAKNPVDRYSSMGGLLTDLMQYWESIPGAAQERIAATTALGEAAGRAASEARRKTRIRRLIPIATGTAATAGLLALIGGALVWGNFFGASPVDSPDSASRQAAVSRETEGEPSAPGAATTSRDTENDQRANEPAASPSDATPEDRAAEPTGDAERQVPASRQAEVLDPEPDPAAIDSYDSARTAALAARARAQEVSAPTLASAPFQRAEALRESAEEAAGAGEHGHAALNMQAARTSYEAAVGSAVAWRARLDSAWQQLEAAKDDADATASAYRQAEMLRQQAQNAESAGSPGLALTNIGSATELYGQAVMREVEPPRTEPTATKAEPEPEPAEIVEATLEELRRAIEAEDLDALQTVWIGLTPQQIRRFENSFDLMRDLRVEFEVRSLQAANGRIDVTISTTYNFINASSRRRESQTFEQQLELGREGGRWVVLHSRG